MGVNPPYLYDPPSHHRPTEPKYHFDPKAVTRASWTTTASDTSTSKPKGPYLNFNRHPDSYIIVPYAVPDLPPLPSRTKKTVVIIRWLQFAFRVTQLLEALGFLVCVSCLKDVENVQSWILRTPVCPPPPLSADYGLTNFSLHVTHSSLPMPSIISYAPQRLAAPCPLPATMSLLCSWTWA